MCKFQQGEAKADENKYQDEEQLFVTSCFSAQNTTKSWLIDSGCTNHMTYNRELFRDLNEAIVSKARVGNGAYIANLLSVSQLTEKGYKVLFGDNNCVIKDARGVDIYKVLIKGKSFVLDLTNEEQVAVHKEDNSTMLWQTRLGHFHHAALLFMEKNNMARGFPALGDEPPKCVACQIYQSQNNQITISRDVHFIESEKWNWENDKQVKIQEDDNVDDDLIRGTKLLSEIYQKCNVALMEPAGYEAAATDQKWVAAMKEELKMIEKKSDMGAQLVVKGYAQIYGVDFSETFAPVARMETIRMLLALAAQKGWTIHQMDVKSEFLNGLLEEEIFVEQSGGFVCKGKEDKKYAKEILKKFNMDECKPSATPMNNKVRLYEKDGAPKVDEGLYRSLIGCLMYLTTTRPNIMNVVSILSSDLDGCEDDIEITLRYCFSFGSGVFSWSSKKKEITAQSTAEAEFVAATAAINQALLSRKIMTDLHMEQHEGMTIFVDNQTIQNQGGDMILEADNQEFNLYAVIKVPEYLYLIDYMAPIC
ncbi:hypothetical protein AgCh_014234 [Apium graveolens]